MRTFQFTDDLPYIYPFSINVPILYPLKTSENQRFSDVSREYWGGTLVENELNRRSVWFNRPVLYSRYYTLKCSKEEEWEQVIKKLLKDASQGLILY